jgi:hypothetical protein
VAGDRLNRQGVLPSSHLSFTLVCTQLISQNLANDDQLNNLNRFTFEYASLGLQGAIHEVAAGAQGLRRRYSTSPE